MTVFAHFRNAFPTFRDREALIDGCCWTFRGLKRASRNCRRSGCRAARGSLRQLYAEPRRVPHPAARHRARRSGASSLNVLHRPRGRTSSRTAAPARSLRQRRQGGRRAARSGRLAAGWTGMRRRRPRLRPAARLDGTAAGDTDLDALCSINYASGSPGCPRRHAQPPKLAGRPKISS